jgi:hypothetical protein
MNCNTQQHTPKGKPLSWKSWAIYSRLRLSKNPKMLKSRSTPAQFAAQVAWILWTRVVTASIVLWWGLKPNWVAGRMLKLRMLALILLAMIFSSAFPVHSRRLIGQ